MNRRDILRNAASAPLVVLPIAAASAAQDHAGDPFASWQAEKFIELPMRPGDEIVGLTVHRGELWAATKRGEMYRIRHVD